MVTDGDQAGYLRSDFVDFWTVSLIAAAMMAPAAVCCTQCVAATKPVL
jgi:hypothetical protein